MLAHELSLFKLKELSHLVISFGQLDFFSLTVKGAKPFWDQGQDQTVRFFFNKKGCLGLDYTDPWWGCFQCKRASHGKINCGSVWGGERIKF